MRSISAIGILLLGAACSHPSGMDREKARARIHGFLDEWHRAAARADSAGYFGRMANDAVYIGTDPTERWKKQAFQRWASPHFKKDTAWSFHPFERHIHFGPRGRTAWFDEKLRTWMGTCRGSGVLVRKSGAWKLVHYHLAKTIPNKKMKKVLRVLRKKGVP